MGQSNESTLSNQSELTKMFVIQNRIKELNLTFLEHKQTRKQYLLKESTFKEEIEQLDRLSKLKTRQSFTSPFLTNLVKYEHNKHEDLCSKYHSIHSLWQYPFRTLADDINDRALARRPYSSHQISTLITQIAEACLVLQQYRTPHERLTSKSVLVQAPGLYRVADPIALGNHPNLDMIYHKRSLKNIYLSPAQCQIIQDENISKPVFDPYREDVFTAGMLVLEAGLLQRQDNCYEDQCSRVNFRQVQYNLKRFEELYGRQIKQQLAMMLHHETANRADWLKLTQILRNSNVIGPVSNFVRESPRDEQMKNNIKVGSNGVPPRTFVRLGGSQIPIHQGTVIDNNQQRPQTTRVSQPIHLIHQYRQSQVPHNQQLYKARPATTLVPTYLHQGPQIKIQAPKQLITTNKTTKASPVRFLNSSQALTTPLKEHIRQPSQFQVKDVPVYCIDQFKNGGRYEGYKVRGKREGWGKYIYQEGGCYEGDWKNDLMCGQGKLYYQSGSLAYDGQLENDLFHGHGNLYNENPQALMGGFNYQNFQDIDEHWISYQGQFRQDKKQGHGRLMLTNGQVYQGSFHEDKVQGQGVFTNRQGTKVRGIWHDNRFQRQLQ